jgi:DNA repair protein SbcD/Mre11
LPSIKIIHTADVHLDASYRFLGDRGEAQRRRVRETFAKICRLAVQDDYDALLISGDLFDTNSVSDESARWAASQLADTGIPVLICPGTHDRLDGRSVYQRPNLHWPQNVHVFMGEEYSRQPLPDLSLTVYAAPNTSQRSRRSPLHGMSRNGSTRWEIAMAHGSVIIPGKVEDTDYPIRRDEIEATGLDYVALGHWHSWGDYTTGRVQAVYPGSPERLAFSGGRGSIACVTLNEGSVAVERLDIGVRKMEDAEVSITGVRDDEEIRRRIAEMADPELAIRVALTGVCGPGYRPDVSALLNELSEHFFHLQIGNHSHPSLSELSASVFSDHMVIGKFIHDMMQRIEEARGDDEQVSILEDAMQLGVALLRGRQAF